MAFKNKTDVYGIEVANTIVCKAVTDSTTAQTAQATDNFGTIIATTVYGETSSPACDYELKADWTPSALKIGGVTGTTNKFMLSSVKIGTSGGSAPTINASGEQVESGAVTDYYYAVPSFTLAKTHHAQTLFTAFELSGNGCHVNSATYDIKGTISKGTKDGETLSSGISGASITVTLTIVATDPAVEPTLTASGGFVITAPLSCTNPDSSYRTYTATLFKALTKTAPTAGT